MERPSALFISGAIAFTLIALGYLLGYGMLSEQTQRIIQLETQTKLTFNNQMELYKNLARLDNTLGEFKTANRGEVKKLLLKIDGITEEIQDWRNEYTAFLDGVRDDIDNLTSVDLGKVNVEKDTKKGR